MPLALSEVPPGRLYAIYNNHIFSRQLDQADWVRGTDYSFPRYGQPYPWIVADPENPNRVWVGYKVELDTIGHYRLYTQKRHLVEKRVAEMANLSAS